jgi:hypothetical protein
MTVKMWDDTVASECRWSGLVMTALGIIDVRFQVVWEDSEADYQGHAAFLGRDPEASPRDFSKWWFYEWGYGSCAGCDGWDGIDEAEIKREIRSSALFFNDATLKIWLDRIDRRPLIERRNFFQSTLYPDLIIEAIMNSRGAFNNASDC